MIDPQKRRRIPAGQIFSNPACFLAFGFGSGLAPIAPGTFGTLVAVPLYLAASSLQWPAYFALTVFMMLAGVWICGRCERTLNVQDHSGIVWDEFVGFFVTMLAVPASATTVVAGFLLFRVFDVWKPWPVRYFDRHVHGGFGVMLDDLLAGIYAGAVLHVIVHLHLI